MTRETPADRLRAIMDAEELRRPARAIESVEMQTVDPLPVNETDRLRVKIAEQEEAIRSLEATLTRERVDRTVRDSQRQSAPAPIPDNLRLRLRASPSPQRDGNIRVTILLDDDRERHIEVPLDALSRRLYTLQFAPNTARAQQEPLRVQELTDLAAADMLNGMSPAPDEISELIDWWANGLPAHHTRQAARAHITTRRRTLGAARNDVTTVHRILFDLDPSDEEIETIRALRLNTYERVGQFPPDDVVRDGLREARVRAVPAGGRAVDRNQLRVAMVQLPSPDDAGPVAVVYDQGVIRFHFDRMLSDLGLSWTLPAGDMRGHLAVPVAREEPAPVFWSNLGFPRTSPHWIESREHRGLAAGDRHKFPLTLQVVATRERVTLTPTWYTQTLLRGRPAVELHEGRGPTFLRDTRDLIVQILHRRDDPRFEGPQERR